MKIILALGNPVDAGGPTKYALQLEKEFIQRGYAARLSVYGFEKHFPSGLRHLFYAARLSYSAFGADAIVAFDTMTVGAPALIASKVTGARLAIRIGGDFVWEQYVERTGDLVKLSSFYAERGGQLSRKERIEVSLTRAVVRHASALMFNSAWQRELWQKAYGFEGSCAHIVENLYPARKEGSAPASRVFVAAGRPIKLKQEALLASVFKNLQARYPDISLDTKPLPPAEHQARVARSYAVIVASVSDIAPNAVIDAVAYGKPFICTSDTGIKERLANAGLFVDTQQDGELSRAIEKLLDPEGYAEAVQKVQGFSFVRTWDDVTNDVLSILQKVCAS